MYASLYRRPVTSMTDNRKFINSNASIYEDRPKVNKYIPDETLEEKINYSYGPNLKDVGAGEVYSYRNNNNYSGNRDESNGLVSKLIKNSNRPLDLESTIQYDRFDKTKVKVDTDRIKESFTVKNESDSSQDLDDLDDLDDSDTSCLPDSDGVKNICGGGKLFPIMDPRFNLRETAKNMILLEDHLFHMGKRCHDCILKHCLTIEGVLEEGITLDIKGEYIKTLENSSNDFRKIFKRIAKKIKDTSTLTNDDCFEIAQNIRKIRKPLCQNFATFV